MTGFNANEIKLLARAAAQAGLYKAGLLVANESLRKVPRDTGALADSIFIKADKNGLSLEVGYSAGYAAAVHNKELNGFLAEPFMELKERILTTLKESIEEVVI